MSVLEDWNITDCIDLIFFLAKTNDLDLISCFPCIDDTRTSFYSTVLLQYKGVFHSVSESDHPGGGGGGGGGCFTSIAIGC